MWELHRFIAWAFYSWDILKLGRFVVGMFCRLGRSVGWHISYMGRFVVGTFRSLGRFEFGMLSLRHFVVGRFVLGRYVGVPKLAISFKGTVMLKNVCI
jgi:hypothetical protein